MGLTHLGWSNFFASNLSGDASLAARIIAVHRSHSRAMRLNGSELNIYLPGQTETVPVVGDWVETTPEFEDEQGEPAAIAKHVLPRASSISRWTTLNGRQTLVANIDRVFIVMSANEDFSVNRLQRYVLLAKDGGAEPVALVSKLDLIENPDGFLAQLQAQLEIPALGTSLISDTGIDSVLKMMPEGSSSVFVGSSGVGKSSLVNRLIGEAKQLTQAIREDDAKGRHTTTGRQMFPVPGHGLIIDTPGLREVQVIGGEEYIDETFPRISELSGSCKFRDCQHGDEPGCAIQEALQKGELDLSEWENYGRLKKEAAYTLRKESKAEMSNAKKRWRNISLMMRNRKKIEE